MQNFKAVAQHFEQYFGKRHFPAVPSNLYDAAQYYLNIPGKRVRPTLCLMGCELFEPISDDVLKVGAAIELFHNFSLVHDDIMDKAPLRRGIATVHQKWNEPTAILAGDVMLVQCYEYLNTINHESSYKIIQLFNQTAKEVCEGQQMDMDFENQQQVSLEEYEKMITLKTSVLLAASIKMGAIIGGTSQGNQQHLYEFGKNLGIAFQVQDDYLDCFGNPDKFGKQVGGDILSNKKTFLLLHALEVAQGSDKAELEELLKTNPSNKVERVKTIYQKTDVDDWSLALKQKYFNEAMRHLEDVAVLSKRKVPLKELAEYILQREA
jgi:geranylgeranyl diphosphate synthase, type II